MNEWTWDPAIAEAIRTGRMVRIPTLRGMAEYSMGIFSDLVWVQIEPKWQWHEQQMDGEVEPKPAP